MGNIFPLFSGTSSFSFRSSKILEIVRIFAANPLYCAADQPGSKRTFEFFLPFEYNDE